VQTLINAHETTLDVSIIIVLQCSKPSSVTILSQTKKEMALELLSLPCLLFYTIPSNNFISVAAFSYKTELVGLMIHLSLIMKRSHLWNQLQKLLF